MINLSVNEDVSDLLEELAQLRLKRSTDFVCVIIPNLKSVFHALETKEKILIRSLFILKPIDQVDAEILLRDFERRYQFKPSVKQKRQLYQWSGGQVGLLKSLYLLLKDNSKMEFSVENLLVQESVLYRLQAVMSELPESKIKALVAQKKSLLEKTFFEKFGFTKHGKILNPLLRPYLEQSELLPAKDYQYLFTSCEADAYRILKRNQEKIVSRDVLAKELWQADWAIDQVMHRIRKKLKAAEAPWELRTKKGLGFVLLPK